MTRTSVRGAFRDFSFRLRARKLACVAVLVITVLVIPQSSAGQSTGPAVALASALGSIGSAISNVIGGGLNAISGILTSIESFEREVVWPQELIDRARTAVAFIQVIFNNIRGLGQVAVASATHPAPRQLVQTLLSA